jgi:hypothetical protein
MLISAEGRTQTGVPLVSTASGRELGMAYRTDDTQPTQESAIRDKRACLMDAKEVSEKEVARLSTLAKADRDAAEREVARAVIPCMAKKGWRTVLY